MARTRYWKMVVIASALVAAQVSTASASAAPGPVSREFGSVIAIDDSKAPVYRATLTAHGTAGTDGVRKEISCTISLSPVTIVRVGSTWGPYDSPTYTSVGGAAWVTCTAVVSRLTVQSALAWAGQVDAVGTTISKPGTAAIGNSYVIDLCSSGEWRVGATASVQWPPGYTGNPNWTYWGLPLTLLPSACN